METVSTLAKIAIEQLLNVHALACMERASSRREHMVAAADWLPKIEETIRSMRREIEERTNGPKT